jgi:sigma factor regulatory protein, fecR/pupR family
MKRPKEIIIKRVLNETATPEEAAEVAAWFSTSEGQRWLSGQFDEDAQALESGASPLLENIPTEELLRRIDRCIARSHRRRLLFRVAAVLIPCALIAGLWANLNSRMGGALFTPVRTETIATAAGERKEVIFQDGTRVFLNAGSTLTYPERFGLSERKVTLDGEAYFRVARNPQRPFIVHVGDEELRVLGTSFDIRAYDNAPTVDIVLLEGSVLFSYRTGENHMSASQKLVFDRKADNCTVTDIENPEQAILWSRNIIWFRNTPMQEVIAELERWYDVEFAVSDPEIYRYTFSLRTPNLPLRELLDELENIAPIRCIFENGIVTISKK